MSHFFRSLAVASIMAMASVATAARSPLAVAVSGGAVSGASVNGVDRWLGIPYAAPPVGLLRWQPPQPAVPWRTTLKADRLSGICAQNGFPGDSSLTGGSEDCLYLNIYRDGTSEAGRKLPVMVWIHGGGFQAGAAREYDPTALVKRGKMIVVTINYRLGVFGFFAHPTLDREGHRFANYGLMDQQAALSWVHDNIARFGGDPADVTIAGESAGGNSVLLHIALPFSAGKFQHAIDMSGGSALLKYPLPGAPRSLAVGEEAGLAFAKAVGCAGDRATACLRGVSTKRILELQGAYLVDQVIIDGTVVPDYPNALLRAVQPNRVTLINGTTRDENRLYVGMQEIASGHVLKGTDYPAKLMGFFGSQMVSRIMAEYPLDGFDSASEAYAQVTTDINVCAVHEVNRLLAPKMPVFAYEFNDGTAPSDLAPTTFPLRDAHSFELQYLFAGNQDAAARLSKLNPLQGRLSDEMIGEFTQPDRMPAGWTLFDPARHNVWTYILPAARMVTGRFAESHRCDFWDKSGFY